MCRAVRTWGMHLPSLFIPQWYLTAHHSDMYYSKQTRDILDCKHLWYVLQQTDQVNSLLHTPRIHLTANNSGMSYSKQTRYTPYCTHQGYTWLQTPLVCLTANRPGILLTAHIKDTPNCTHLWYVLQQTDQRYCTLLHTPLDHKTSMFTFQACTSLLTKGKHLNNSRLEDEHHCINEPSRKCTSLHIPQENTLL